MLVFTGIFLLIILDFKLKNIMRKFCCLLFRYTAILTVFGILNSCSSDSAIDAEEAQRYQTIYQSLKDNQSKFVFQLDGDEFYKSESIFSGRLEMYLGSFTMSYFDQFGSNVMIHFGGQKWFTARPIKIPIKLDNGYSSNVMFGKIINKEEKLGAGYLMNAGIMTFKVFTKEKIIIVIEGKAKKYPKVDTDSPSFNVKATIICKNPSFDDVDIDGKDSFYGQ